jgi:hypothetical protein
MLPSSWNRFAHVEGDPTNLNDPFGLTPFVFDINIYSAKGV